MNQVRSMTLLAACVCLCVGAFVAVAWARQIDTSFPPVFSQLSLEEAKAKANAEDRILVVKGTAGWCGPCRTMDKTTWRDAKVEAWFKEKGIAIQLNVDRSAKEAQDLRIKAIPAMVAFKGDKEIGRIVGLQSAEQLLAWLGRIDVGLVQKSSDLVERLRKARAATTAISIDERVKLGEDLLAAGKLDAATDEFVGLNMELIRNGAQGGPRIRITPGMRVLAKEHPSALEKFKELRRFHREHVIVSKGEFMENFHESRELDRLVGDSSDLLAYFDNMQWSAWPYGVLAGVEDDLREQLELKGRWVEAGAFFKTAEWEFERAKAVPIEVAANAEDAKATPEQRAARLKEMRDRMGRVYGGYLAANGSFARSTYGGGWDFPDGEEHGARFAELAIQFDDTAEMRVALVAWALEAKRPREGQRGWLNQAALMGADVIELRAKLEEALKAKAAAKER